jgi:hypothetical protein
MIPVRLRRKRRRRMVVVGVRRVGRRWLVRRLRMRLALVRAVAGRGGRPAAVVWVEVEARGASRLR